MITVEIGPFPLAWAHCSVKLWQLGFLEIIAQFRKQSLWSAYSRKQTINFWNISGS